jgi:hypothetical protein
VNALLPLAIWASLFCFALAEAGKRAVRLGRARPWLGPVSGWGVLLLLAHFALAFHLRYRWSQEAAVRETARQTAETFGFDWGGGVFVNYLFALVWAVDAWSWHARPARAAARATLVRWTLRAFYLTIIASGAVVFVVGARRWLGVLLALWIAWSWRPITTPSRSIRSAGRPRRSPVPRRAAPRRARPS